MKISDSKSHSVHLRLSDEQFDFCKFSSETLGVNLTDYIRMIINSQLVFYNRFASNLDDDSKKALLGDLDANNKSTV